VLLFATAAGANAPNLVQKPIADFQQQPFDPVMIIQENGRDNLAFSSGIQNTQGVASVAPGPLMVTGSRPDVTVNTMSAVQTVDGTKTLVGALQYNVSPSHQHWHFLNLDRYQLRAHDPGNAVLGIDQKSGFCLAATLNNNCGVDNPDLLGLDESLLPGGVDYYSANRDGQYIDVTGFPSGLYELVEWVNSDCSLIEATHDDNAQAMVVQLGAGNPPTVSSHPEITPYFDTWWASHAHCLPHETVRPQISGSPVAGSQLTASPGSWLNRLASGFGYQWRRCSAAGAGCADIPGATSPTYAPTPADVGYTLRARVTATQGLAIEQLTAQDSDPTAAVAPASTSGSTSTSTSPAPSKAARLSTSARVKSRITLQALLRHGVTFKVHCSQACRVHARLVASVQGRHRHPVSLLLGVADFRMSRAGTLAGHLKLSGKLRARLPHRKLPSLTLRVTVRGGDGQRRGIVRRIRVIR
jgi:predicted actin-binding protein/lysyl oxidase